MSADVVVKEEIESSDIYFFHPYGTEGRRDPMSLTTEQRGTERDFGRTWRGQQEDPKRMNSNNGNCEVKNSRQRLTMYVLLRKKGSQHR